MGGRGPVVGGGRWPMHIIVVSPHAKHRSLQLSPAPLQHQPGYSVHSSDHVAHKLRKLVLLGPWRVHRLRSGCVRSAFSVRCVCSACLPSCVFRSALSVCYVCASKLALACVFPARYDRVKARASCRPRRPRPWRVGHVRCRGGGALLQRPTTRTPT